MGEDMGDCSSSTGLADPKGSEPSGLGSASGIPIAGAPPRKVWPLEGYAPGGYMGRCRVCKAEFIADKRACQCLECAVASAHARISATESLLQHVTEVEGRLRIALWNELRRGGVPQDRAIELIREAAQGMSPGTAETQSGSGPKDGQPGR